MPVADIVVTRPALWLLGHGVAASPSPAMQNAALRACGLDWEYAIRDVLPEELDAALAEMRGGAARGGNVTMPHKRTVAAACDELHGDATVTGAVNTLVVDGGRLVGDNTDALGLEGALREAELWPNAATSVVVLGAGGAAAAAVLALGRAGAAIRVAARRQDAAAAMAAEMAAHVPSVEPIPWNAGAVHLALLAAPLSMLVNATPAGMAFLPVDVAALPASCTVVDLRNRPRPVDLVVAAQARGLRACDGLGMLLHQGMLSFRRWTGLEPPWDAARAALASAVVAS